MCWLGLGYGAGECIVLRVARFLGEEVEMFWLWVKLAVTNEKFCFIPVAKTPVCIDTFATVATAAVVKI